MDIYAIIEIIVLILSVGIFVITTRVYQNIRSDSGYNVGRNHMHDLGFTDEDIKQDQDDADADMYVFRKQNNHNKNEE